MILEVIQALVVCGVTLTINSNQELVELYFSSVWLVYTAKKLTGHLIRFVKLVLLYILSKIVHDTNLKRLRQRLRQ